MSSSLAFVWLLQVTAASFFAAQAELLPVYNPRPGRRVIVFQSTVFGHELCLSDNWCASARLKRSPVLRFEPVFGSLAGQEVVATFLPVQKDSARPLAFVFAMFL